MSRTWKGLDLQTLEKQSKYPVKAHTGIRYPCTQRDIDAYADFDPVLKCLWKGVKGGYMSDVDSVRRLSEFLEPNTLLPSNIAAAFSRCRDATRGRTWGPETISKALFDLDTALFDGHLRGLIIVRWVTPDSTDCTRARRATNWKKLFGLTYYVGKRRSIIYLNAIEIFALAADPEKKMWQTMIHELLVSGNCHCYLNATTGAYGVDELDEIEGWTDGHGWQFRWLLNLIDVRFSWYVGFNVMNGDRRWQQCLFCTARSESVPRKVADDYIRGGHTHDPFCPRSGERSGQTYRYVGWDFRK